MSVAEQFAEESILAAARRIDGLDDFGDDAFRAPLRVLLESLAEAPIHELGASILRGSVVRSLANRLRARHWLRHHPEIAFERIEAPLVVVGMMRTGTTLVQRLLAADPRHYCVLGWEALEPAPRLGDQSRDDPPIVDTSREDPRVAAAEAREAQIRAFAPELFAIHPSYAHQAEEEIMFLADAFLSHVPEASCDVPRYRSWIDDQDFAPAYRHLHRMLQLLQWQKKRRGERRGRWVLKTPAHMGYLETLFAELPDAHVIHMHRDPVETIPSGASLNATLWRMHAHDVDPRQVGAQWIERMAWTNRRAVDARARMPAGSARFTDIWYRDAVKDPIGQIRRIYAAAGIEPRDDAERAMRTWLVEDAKERDTLARHRYTAADFGLTDEQIRSEFATYIERYLAPRELE